MSIRLKIVLIFLSFVLVSVGYYQFYWVPKVTISAEDGVAAAARRHIKSVADGLVPLLLQNQLDAIHETLDRLHRDNPDWLAITLHDAAGRRLFPLDEAAAPRALNIRTLIQPIRAQGAPLGILAVTIDFAPALDPQLKDYRSLALLLGGGFLIFLLCVGLALEIFVRRPTRQLAEAANLLARGNFDAALPKPRRDEIGTLVASFSSMRDQIQADQDALRRARSELEVRVIERTGELRETNDALVHSEALFRDFAGSASDRFWECDRNYRFTLRWDSDRSNLMLPRDEFIGRTFWDIHDGMAVRQLKEIMERNAPFREYEIEIFPVDGRPRFCRLSGKPVFDRNGAFAGYRGVAKDVSEEVELRIAGEETARRLESITEYSPTAISLEDIDGRYQFVNRRFTEWFGVAGEDAIGKTAHDLFPKEMADSYVALDREVRKTLRAHSREREVAFVGDRKRVVFITKFPVLDRHGALAGVGTIHVDMTAARNVEEQLR